MRLLCNIGLVTCAAVVVVVAKPHSEGPEGRSARSVAKGIISKKKCEEYSKYVYQEIPTLDGKGTEQVDLCQFHEPLVSNGEDARPREYPHMALIGYGQRNNIKWLCGGTLISERFILSAAHCTSPGNIEANWVRLGDFDISTENDNKKGEAASQTFEIKRRTNHPKYDPGDKYNDIALYELDRNVVLGESMRPACLHTEYEFNKTGVLATGWGNISPGKENSRSSILKKVFLPINPTNVCSNTYKEILKKNKGNEILKNGIQDDSMFCAGGKDGKDTCSADSGGPLQIVLKHPYCMYSQVGITSFGFGNCAGPTPGVYTRVSHYIQWIESVVWP